jgi:hypothetical protein
VTMTGSDAGTPDWATRSGAFLVMPVQVIVPARPSSHR